MKTILTNSSMSCFSKCPRQYYYRYVAGIRSRFAATALRFGSAVHECLDLLAKGVELQGVCDWLRHQYTSSEYYLWCDEDGRRELDIECESVLTLVLAYEWYWSDAGNEIIQSESVFQMPIRSCAKRAHANRRYDLAGKIDKQVRRPDGRLAVMEHKTTGETIDGDSQYWEILRLDPQIGIYYLAMLDSPNQPDHVLYDVIHKPGISPTPVPLRDEEGLRIVLDSEGNRVRCKNGKPRETASKEDGWVLQTREMTVAEWGQKLHDDIVSRPEFYFRRREVARTEDDLVFLRNEIADKAKLIGHCQKSRLWPQNISRDTCGFCEFVGLCERRQYPILGVLDELPESLIFVDNVHPELEVNHGTDSIATASATS